MRKAALLFCMAFCLIPATAAVQSVSKSPAQKTEDYLVKSYPVTTTGAERAGFPFRVSSFAGLADMKRQIVVHSALEPTRSLVPVFGVELSVGPWSAKLSGGKSQGSGGSGGKGGGGGKGSGS